jgi:signal transduction histidine kinase
MNYRIENISNIGVNKQDSLRKKRVTRMVNQAAVIGIFFCSVSTIINLLTGFFSSAFFPFISGLLFATVPYYNSIGKYTKAKVIFSAIGYTTTFLIVSIVEISTYTFYYFICVFAMTLMFFPAKKQHGKILTITLFCMCGSLSIAHFELFPKIEVANSLFFGILNAVLLLFMLYVIVYSLVKENGIFEEKTIDLLDSINEKNEELVKEKNKVEATASTLIKTNSHLEQEILEREKIERSLRESNQMLRQFAYVASHDMKEPLRTIGNFSGLLAHKLKGKLSENEAEYLDFITDGVGRMSTLVDDLLKYAQLSNPMTYEEVNLNNTVFLISHSLKNLLDRKNVKLTIGQLPTLTANPSQVQQLFQNLMSNGIKFNNKSNPEIQIDCTEDETAYTFSVRDNGIGIPVEDQQRIWMIFQRLHSRAKFEGTGIGLAVVQKIVNNHQGNIWLESVENEGTTFFFTILKNLQPPSAELIELQETIDDEIVQN